MFAAEVDPATLVVAALGSCGRRRGRQRGGAESLNSLALMTSGGGGPRLGWTRRSASRAGASSQFIQQVRSPPGQFMMPGAVYFTQANLIILLPLSPELFT